MGALLGNFSDIPYGINSFFLCGAWGVPQNEIKERKKGDHSMDGMSDTVKKIVSYVLTGLLTAGLGFLAAKGISVNLCGGGAQPTAQASQVPASK